MHFMWIQLTIKNRIAFHKQAYYVCWKRQRPLRLRQDPFIAGDRQTYLSHSQVDTSPCHWHWRRIYAARPQSDPLLWWAGSHIIPSNANPSPSDRPNRCLSDWQQECLYNLIDECDLRAPPRKSLGEPPEAGRSHVPLRGTLTNRIRIDSWYAH